MSTQTDDHSDSDAVEAHDGTPLSEAGGPDHHGFDPEPVSEIADEEPRTPMWMPAVGVTLLVAGGLYFATGDDAATDETAPVMTTWAAPGNAAEAPPKAPSPAQAQQIRQKIDDFQARQRGQAPSPRPQRRGVRPGQRPAQRPGARPTPPTGH